MKEMSKVQIYLNESIDLILSERQILSQLHHLLISNLNYAFHDKEYLYLILDYLPGGELRYYMKNDRYVFNESQIKFFVSNIILSLRYIHKHNIIHRDIKPENLIFDSKGYLHLTDFNISKKIRKNKPILNKSGTIGYLSPEVILNKPQNFASDFYAVGIICYELVMGKIPFNGRNKKELAEKILYKKIALNEHNMLGDYSVLMGDFINKLLRRNYKERLGYKNIDEIMNHPWLEGINWDLIENKLIDVKYIPFLPPTGDNFDNHRINKEDKTYIKNYDEYLKIINNSKYFKKFYYNYKIPKRKSIQERTAIINKNTNIEGRKSAELIEVEHNDVSLLNNNDNTDLSFIKTTAFNNNDKKPDFKKPNIEPETNFPKKMKTIYQKTNLALKKTATISNKQRKRSNE